MTCNIYKLNNECYQKLIIDSSYMSFHSTNIERYPEVTVTKDDVRIELGATIQSAKARIMPLNGSYLTLNDLSILSIYLRWAAPDTSYRVSTNPIGIVALDVQDNDIYAFFKRGMILRIEESDITYITLYRITEILPNAMMSRCLWKISREEL